MLKLCVLHEELVPYLEKVEKYASHVELLTTSMPQQDPHAYLLVNCALRRNVAPNSARVLQKYCAESRIFMWAFCLH